MRLTVWSSSAGVVHGVYTHSRRTCRVGGDGGGGGGGGDGGGGRQGRMTNTRGYDTRSRFGSVCVYVCLYDVSNLPPPASPLA